MLLHFLTETVQRTTSQPNDTLILTDLYASKASLRRCSTVSVDEEGFEDMLVEAEKAAEVEV